MNAEKKALLKVAMERCDEEDKSTEFMIQYMQDVANASFDEVMEFLSTDGGFQPESEKKNA